MDLSEMNRLHIVYTIITFWEVQNRGGGGGKLE